MEEVGEFDVKAAQQAFHRNLQHIELGNVYLDLVIRCNRNCADQFDGQRNDLVQCPMKSDLISIAGERNVF